VPTNVIKQLPLNPNIALDGLASQITGTTPFASDNLDTTTGLDYAAQIQTPVTFLRNSQGLTHNPVTGDLIIDEIDDPSFGGIGIQVSPIKINELDNSDMRNGTASYLITDAGGVIVTSTTETSGISESDTAFRLRMVNTTGNPQTVSVRQAISGTAAINDYYTAQVRYSVLEIIGAPIAVVRVFDNTNSQITSSNPFVFTIADDRYRIESATQQLVAASTDLRWELFVTIADTETLDLRFTNAQMAISSSRAHYVTSVVAPTTRATDVIDVGSTNTPFFAQATDEMWSIDFHTLGPLSTLSGTSQLQYIFSSFNGVNGTNIFVDDPNTITSFPGRFGLKY